DFSPFQAAGNRVPAPFFCAVAAVENSAAQMAAVMSVLFMPYKQPSLVFVTKADGWGGLNRTRFANFVKKWGKTFANFVNFWQKTFANFGKKPFVAGCAGQLTAAYRCMGECYPSKIPELML
ncbi:MAG: hypothetical protein ILP18_12290, partial [Treponema sp.]|nr:hypothetical protein [Treponema sp.]